MASLSPNRNIKMSETSFLAISTNSAPLILVVDDDDDSREMVGFLLQSWNYSVVEAKNGFEAIRLTEKMRPEAILMDLKLPDMDGLEATSQIRQADEIKNTPIFFLSGCAEPIFRQAALAAGANEYLTKPLDFDRLRAALEKYVRCTRFL